MQLTIPFPTYKLREIGGFVLREAHLEVDAKPVLDTPQQVADFWRGVITRSPRFDASVENFAILHLNTRKRLISYRLLGCGTLDTLLVHPREVFRQAILENASGICLVHNHPSGDPTPSEADIKVTRELMRGGQLLKIEVVDHVIIGDPVYDRDQPVSTAGHRSLRALGYFYHG